MPTVSTRPPYSDGAILSTCIEPLATASPCMAYLQQLQLRPRLRQQCVGRHHGGYRRGGRAAQP